MKPGCPDECRLPCTEVACLQKHLPRTRIQARRHAVRFRRIDLNLLPVFDALYRERSVRRAADALGVAQPTLSNALSRLRGLFHDELFVRAAGGMRPTPTADRVANLIARALRDILSAVEGSQEFNFQEEDRTFVLATTGYIDAVMTARVMDWITWIAPRISIELLPLLESTGTAQKRSFRQSEVELFVGTTSADSHPFGQEIMMDSWTGIARTEHPGVDDDLSLEDYLALNHVAFPEQTVDLLLREKGLARRITVHGTDYARSVNLIAQTEFVATVPERLARYYTEYFPIRLFKCPLSIPPMRTYQGWSAHSETDPGHAWLRQVIFNFAQRI
ncbi:MAG: LysR family transcriptional regulator [Aquisalimonadaceae bacterium]